MGEKFFKSSQSTERGNNCRFAIVSAGNRSYTVCQVNQHLQLQEVKGGRGVWMIEIPQEFG